MNTLHVKSIEFTHIFCVRSGFWRSLPFLSLLCRQCYSCYTTVEIEVRTFDFVL